MLNSWRQQLEVSLDECHFDHTAEIDGRLFESGEDAAAFLQPADHSFDNVPLAISFLVKVDWAGIAIFILLRWDDRCDVHFQKHFVDPFGTISLVPCDRSRPCDHFAVSGRQFVVNAVEQLDQTRIFVSLTCGKLEVNRTSVGITDQVNFGGKTALGMS
jgi:hypothetical protein